MPSQAAVINPPGSRLSSQPQSVIALHYLVGTKLYCLVTEAHVCEQLAQGRYVKVERPRVETYDLLIASSPSFYFNEQFHCVFESWIVSPSLRNCLRASVTVICKTSAGTQMSLLTYLHYNATVRNTWNWYRKTFQISLHAQSMQRKRPEAMRVCGRHRQVLGPKWVIWTPYDDPYRLVIDRVCSMSSEWPVYAITPQQCIAL